MTFLALLLVLTIVLWIWAVVDILKAEFKNPSLKLVVIVALLIAPVIGSVLYFQFKRQFIVGQKRIFHPKFI
jgi:hypothetical protein